MRPEIRQYLVNPDFHAERKADYKAADRIRKAFTMVTEAQMTKAGIGVCGNLSNELSVNIKTHKVSMISRPNSFKDRAASIRHEKKYAHFYESISAALLLYRVVCLFPNPKIALYGSKGYKYPWFAYMRHKQSGMVIGLGEWKGAASVHSSLHDISDARGKFKEDLELLLNLILSDRSPHPYDKLTAGGVA